jgi:hypothetical protein
MPRSKLPIDVKMLALHEAGYRCANPACRQIITLDIHHIVTVAQGGGDGAENLLTLCPTCHAMHHRGVITGASIRAWKYLLMALNEAFDRRSIDALLLLNRLGELELTPDGLMAWAGLVSSGYAEPRKVVMTASGGAAVVSLRLTDKGKAFVAGWMNGDQRAALGDSAPPIVL